MSSWDGSIVIDVYKRQAPNSLTKELRIYALMRLGITDGQELALSLIHI